MKDNSFSFRDLPFFAPYLTELIYIRALVTLLNCFIEPPIPHTKISKRLHAKTGAKTSCNK